LISRQQCKGNPLFRFHGNIKQLYVVDGNMFSSTKGMYCCVPMTTVVAQTHHSVTLYCTYITCAVSSFTQSFESYAENLLLSSNPTLYNLIIVTKKKLIKTEFLGAFAKLRKAAIRIVMSVCLFAWNWSAPTGRVFMKFGIRVFFKNRSIKLKFY